MKKITETKMIPHQYTKYVAEDGTEFLTEQQCIYYEQTVKRAEKALATLPQWNLNMPFIGWDMEEDTQKLYVLRDEKDYNNLETYYVAVYGEDTWYGDPPEHYPVAYVVIGREGYVNGWETNSIQAKGFHDMCNLFYEVLFDISTGKYNVKDGEQ